MSTRSPDFLTATLCEARLPLGPFWPPVSLDLLFTALLRVTVRVLSEVSVSVTDQATVHDLRREARTLLEGIPDRNSYLLPG